MNGWGSQREVEKVKKPSQLERHTQLRKDIVEFQALLGRRDLAIVATLGGDNPIRQDLRKATELLDRLACELRGAQ